MRAPGAPQLFGLGFRAGQAKNGGRRQRVLAFKGAQLGNKADKIVFGQVAVQDDERAWRLGVHGQRLASAAGFAQFVGQLVKIIGQQLAAGRHAAHNEHAQGA